MWGSLAIPLSKWTTLDVDLVIALDLPLNAEKSPCWMSPVPPGLLVRHAAPRVKANLVATVGAAPQPASPPAQHHSPRTASTSRNLAALQASGLVQRIPRRGARPCGKQRFYSSGLLWTLKAGKKSGHKPREKP